MDRIHPLYLNIVGGKVEAFTDHAEETGEDVVDGGNLVTPVVVARPFWDLAILVVVDVVVNVIVVSILSPIMKSQI